MNNKGAASASVELYQPRFCLMLRLFVQMSRVHGTEFSVLATCSWPKTTAYENVDAQSYKNIRALVKLKKTFNGFLTACFAS